MSHRTLSLVFCSNSYRHNFLHQEKFYRYCAKKLKKLYFINTYYLLNKSKIHSSEHLFVKNFLPKNIIIFEPKNYKQLNDFLIQKKLVSLISLGRDFSYFKILYLLKKNNCKVVINLSIGYYRDKSFFLKKENIFNFFKFIFYKKISFLFFRFLVFLNILPKVEILFEGSLKNKKVYDNLLDRKYLKWANLDYIKEVIRINYRAYDNIVEKINHTKIENKYIVFVDSGFDHPDVINQEGKHSKQQVDQYYNLLNKTLNKISKIYNKKIIFCLHPKTSKSLVKNYFKKIKVVKYKSQYYLFKAYIVLYHNSSIILDAIFLEKRIINLQSDIMGNFYKRQNKLYAKEFKSKVIKMENFVRKISNMNYYKNSNFNHNKNSKFLKNYLTANIKDFKNIIKTKNISRKKITHFFQNFKNKPGYIQIYLHLKNRFNIN